MWQKIGIKSDSLSYDNSNDQGNNLEDPFDPRPANEDYKKPNIFQKIYASVTDSFVCRKITDFFAYIGGGVLAAADHVASMFRDRGVSAETAAKNVKADTHLQAKELAANFRTGQNNHPITFRDLSDSDHRDSLSVFSAQSSKSEMEPDVDVGDNLVSPLYDDNSKFEKNADEQAFAQWLNKYKEFGGLALCEQNFEARARKVAQKIYDAEVNRHAQAIDENDLYWISRENQTRLKAAAALLGKDLPGSEKLSSAEINDPPTFHPDHKHSFLVWRAWIEKDEWPDEGLPDLQSALTYAKAFIASHTEPPEKYDEKTKLELVVAFELVAHENEYALQQINTSADPFIEELLKSSENASEGQSLGQGEPPAPPPPRRAKTDSVKSSQVRNSLAVPSLPDFPNEANSLVLSTIRNTYELNEFRNIIKNAKIYFRALKKGRNFSEEHKANAITLASLWESAKLDREKKSQLKRLEFFDDLDQLLHLEKIKNDFQ